MLTVDPTTTQEQTQNANVPGSQAQTQSAEIPALQRFRECLERGDFAQLAEVYAPDALLDANVPAWRFQLQGLEDITEQYRAWYPRPTRINGWRVLPTPWGAVLELAEEHDHGEHRISYRSGHILVLVDRRVTEHTFYCTGEWDEETVERHRAEAPMVRW